MTLSEPVKRCETGEGDRPAKLDGGGGRRTATRRHVCAGSELSSLSRVIG